MKITVHKFGGASVADGSAILHAVSLVDPGAAAVVVSALFGVTDILLAAARKAGDGDDTAARTTAAELGERYRAAARTVVPAGPIRAGLIAQIDEAAQEFVTLCQGLLVLRELTPRTLDYLLARGEVLSARVMAAGLAAKGRQTLFVSPLELIHTDGRFGGASPDLARTDAAIRKVLRPLLRQGVVPVVPGFLGVAPDGRVATLGRGGSDLTATLLARALQAQAVYLWKDVEGLLTADPRVVPDARVIPQLNIREAAELAYYGAKVLHPRALTPVIGKKVPIFVRPFRNPGSRGTEISGRKTLTRYPVKALSAVGGQTLLTVTGNGMLGVPGVAARTFAALHKESISVSLISQASSEHSICFSVPEGEATRARGSLLLAFREEIARHEIDDVEVRGGLATLAVVGLGMAGTPGIAARVFSALSAEGINIVAIAQGSSELNISLVIEAKGVARAQRCIHDAFQLSKIGGGAVPATAETDVILLGFGLIGRTLARLLPSSRKKGTALRLVAVIDRGGFVFRQKGVSPQLLKQLLAAKDAGTSLAEATDGIRATPEQALAQLSRYALSRPILVDVTANDTLPLLLSVLPAGMDLVLANKRPLSGKRRDADQLKEAATRAGRRLRFEATVGAGLPILDTYRKLEESGDKVLKIEGCLSGTLGFLFTELERGILFSAAVREARARGYTEPDPRDDLGGADVVRKALILGRLLGFTGERDGIQVESLVAASARSLSLEAFLARLEQFDEEWVKRLEKARQKDQVMRYLATVTRGKIEVGLLALDRTSPFAALKGTDNQVAFTTQRYRKNPLIITGPGAGPEVTAAGILNDICELAGP